MAVQKGKERILITLEERDVKKLRKIAKDKGLSLSATGRMILLQTLRQGELF